MTDLDHYVIPRTHWAPLRDLLDQIPAVLALIETTLCRQDVLTDAQVGTSGEIVQPLPINEAASNAHDDLQGELGIWVRHTIKHRALPGPSSTQTIALAHWLSRHLIDLAQCPEADIAYDGIDRAISKCWRVCDRPQEKVRTFDDEQRDQLRALELSARDCANMAARFNLEGAISQRRIKYLADEGRLMPVRIRLDGKRETRIFRLGHVLDAHQNHTDETAQTA